MNMTRSDIAQTLMAVFAADFGEDFEAIKDAVIKQADVDDSPVARMFVKEAGQKGREGTQ